MSIKQKFIQTVSDGEFMESTMQPSPVDINDYYTKRAYTDTYSSFKPSLKPLKWSNTIKKHRQRELDVEALEANQKRIIYIKTFNHVKNEAIVAQSDLNIVKNYHTIPPEIGKQQRHSNGKKKISPNFDSQLAISFFRKNKEKFNPLKQIKAKPVLSDRPPFDENSPDPKDFAFLTGVNIQEIEVPQENQEFSESQIEERELEIIPENPSQNVLRESQINGIKTHQNSSSQPELQKSLKEHNKNLPLLKPSTASAIISVSEARYKRYLNQKPKMYISAKANSVQAFGRPSSHKEHLVRVYNKEATPVVPYSLVDHLGPRKDYKKALLDSYLSQFNLEALKDIDEDLYQYAKQQNSR